MSRAPRVGDQVEASEAIDRSGLVGEYAHVREGERGVVVEEHASLLGPSSYDVEFRDESGRQRVIKEIDAEELKESRQFFRAPVQAQREHHRVAPRRVASSSDPMAELTAMLTGGCVTVLLVGAIVGSALALTGGFLWAPVVGFKAGWPTGPLGGYYVMGGLNVLVLAVGGWVAWGLLGPERETWRVAMRTSVAGTLLVGGLVTYIFVLPHQAHKHLELLASQEAAPASTGDYPGVANSENSDDGGSEVDRESGAGSASDQQPPSAQVAGTTWPAGKTGYTVALASMRSRDGADVELSRAERAGLDVGYARSDLYKVLRPGWWFVFAGVYDGFSEAKAAATEARRAGFDGAYPRQMDGVLTDASASGDSTDTSSTAADAGAVGMEWPSGKTGYTVALASMRGRSGAEKEFQRAQAASLDAGYVRSGRYEVLRPGWWFVYTGVYNGFSEAKAAAKRAQAQGFEGAYPREMDGVLR